MSHARSSLAPPSKNTLRRFSYSYVPTCDTDLRKHAQGLGSKLTQKNVPLVKIRCPVDLIRGYDMQAPEFELLSADYVDQIRSSAYYTCGLMKVGFEAADKDSRFSLVTA